MLAPVAEPLVVRSLKARPVRTKRFISVFLVVALFSAVSGATYWFRQQHLREELARGASTGDLTTVRRCIDAGADIILLDNMSLPQLRAAVRLVKARPSAAAKPLSPPRQAAGRKAAPKTEASGGVTLQTVRAIAKTGVDYVSVGALTHSAQAVDIALDFL